MSYDVDATLAEIQRLRERIETLQVGPERARLEAQRDQLRDRARLAADAARPVSHLRAELYSVEEQLKAMDAQLIKPALHEHYKVITDPAAYRRRINERIEAGDADRRIALELRRAELLSALEAAQTD